MKYETILVDKSEGIQTITLNRPDRLNALTATMRVELRLAFEDAAADEKVKVVILTGAGRAFCAGAEVQTVVERSEMANDEPARSRRLLPVQTPRVQAVMRALEKPTICAINGVTVGAGTGYALTCDILIASELAKFRLGYTRIGTSPMESTSFLLPRRVGLHHALEIAYTNDLIDAKEMERIGLVNHVVPHEQLIPAAREMAKKMFQIPPIILGVTKKMMWKGFFTDDIDLQLSYELLGMNTMLAMEDAKEAQKSFLEKRPPVYKGK